MKKIVLYLYCIFLPITCLFLFSGCSNDDNQNGPAPVAAFSVPSGNFSTACPILFLNNSELAQTYSWNFGDGTTSAEASPTHTFAQAGSYTVTLTATGAGGSNSATQTLTITQAPAVTNTAKATITNNGVTSFISNSYSVQMSLGFIVFTFSNQAGEVLELGVPASANANGEYTYALADMTNNDIDYLLNYTRANGREYVPTTGNNGVLKVLVHDKCARIIKGTFSGTLKYTDFFNNISDPMTVSNGTFEMQY